MVKEIKEIWYGNGNEDKCDVFVILWKAAAISKNAAKELCGPIAYKEGSNRRLAAYRQVHKDEEIPQLFDYGRASGKAAAAKKIPAPFVQGQAEN